tara:strand:- start:1099 stop:1437 length:339 start_codon:yes stop_codon:yes gene_type:complete
VQEIISKFKDIGLILALVSTIGGGFYAYGVFNQRLDALENKKFVINQKVDLSEIRQTIKELDNDLTVQIQFLQKQIQQANVEINVNRATIEYLDAKLNELKLETNNPLLQGL